MPQTKFSQGKPLMIDYTPGAAVSAGDVVIQGDVPMIAHVDIAANRQGALAIGGGVYQVTADGAIAVGKRVFWDDTNNKVTLTAAGNKPFGKTITAAAANNDLIYVAHEPIVPASVADKVGDPGASGAIPVTSSGYVPIVTAGAETRTLAAPTFIGQELLLYMKTDGGDCVITSAAAFNQAGNTTITMNDAGDTIRLHAIESGANLRWRVVVNDGCTLA